MAISQNTCGIINQNIRHENQQFLSSIFILLIYNKHPKTFVDLQCRYTDMNCDLFGRHSSLNNCYGNATLILKSNFHIYKHTVKSLKIGTPEIITIIVLQLEQLDFTVQFCVQKMQTE